MVCPGFYKTVFSDWAVVAPWSSLCVLPAGGWKRGLRVSPVTCVSEERLREVGREPHSTGLPPYLPGPCAPPLPPLPLRSPPFLHWQPCSAIHQALVFSPRSSDFSKAGPFLFPLFVNQDESIVSTTGKSPFWTGPYFSAVIDRLRVLGTVAETLICVEAVKVGIQGTGFWMSSPLPVALGQ